MNHFVLHLAAIIFVALYTLVTVYNGLMYSDLLGNMFLNKLCMVISLIAIIYLMMNRDTYLPFLGPTVMPPSAFSEYQQEKFDKKITINVPKDQSEAAIKVIYWAAEPGEEKMSPREAYKNFTNYGVSLIKDNKADAFIRCPSSYNVNRFGHMKQLPKHLHYRIIYNSGIISRVNTIKLTDC